MAAMDHVFKNDLRHYLVQTTTPEGVLLGNLRQETAAVTGCPQMLSGPVEGQLLHLLVQLSGAKTVLEIGTFTGYSALHMARALPVDGKLMTCENRVAHAALAQKYFDRSPHGHKIEIRLGDATQTIEAIKTLTFDFIFLDADKARYPLYYDQLIPLLRVGGLMVVDNALWGGEVTSPQSKEAHAIHQLNQKAREDNRVETVILSVRDGMLLIRKL